jgi:hypothetical protein
MGCPRLRSRQRWRCALPVAAAALTRSLLWPLCRQAVDALAACSVDLSNSNFLNSRGERYPNALCG